jgi:hypothetical protein
MIGKISKPYFNIKCGSDIGILWRIFNTKCRICIYKLEQVKANLEVETSKSNHPADQSFLPIEMIMLKSIGLGKVADVVSSTLNEIQ